MQKNLVMNINNTARKKILVLTPRFPYPVIGGDRLRIYKLCEELSKKYDLILLSLCDDKKEMSYEVADGVFEEIHRVYLPKYQSYINSLFSLISNKPLQVAYYKSFAFKKKLSALLEECDAVFCHLIRMGDYVKDVNKIKFLEMTDAISLNYKRVREIKGKVGFKSLIYSFEQKRLEHYERNIADSFDLTTFVSEIDSDFLYPEKRYNVIVAGNGVDTSILPFKSRNVDSRQPVELVFIGNMLSLQNMDAVLYFSKKILPALNCKGKYIFKVIGKIAENDRATLNSISNVLATGTVDSVVDASTNGHIGICSMRLGAGVQNKVLEYMALGMPCITSSVGFEGIGAVNNKDIIMADLPEDYIIAIEKLVSDANYYASVASSARTFVETNYSWEAKLSTFITSIDKHFYLGN